jgi:A/G-specific adenine glycosylase
VTVYSFLAAHRMTFKKTALSRTPWQGGSGGIARVRRALLAWYRMHKRDLPWRHTRDPYGIWISEIMLQQTRVSVVIPYYERFLALFPNAAALAAAREQDLLAAWAGLGYYSRARNLQKAARLITGLPHFPNDYPAIRELPGVGEYTAAAVASIAFGHPHAALDGNVLRVLSRLGAERGDIQSPVVRKRLGEIAAKLLDRRHPGDFNQALMELGATVCLPKQPLCADCPIGKYCCAREQGIERELPLRGGRRVASRRAVRLLAIEKGGQVLLWRRPAESRRLAGFWELPEREQIPQARVGETAGKFRHTIVHTTYLVQVDRAWAAHSPAGFQWIAKADLAMLPLSTTARKALKRLGIK